MYERQIGTIDIHTNNTCIDNIDSLPTHTSEYFCFLRYILAPSFKCEKNQKPDHNEVSEASIPIEKQGRPTLGGVPLPSRSSAAPLSRLEVENVGHHKYLVDCTAVSWNCHFQTPPCCGVAPNHTKEEVKPLHETECCFSPLVGISLLDPLSAASIAQLFAEVINQYDGLLFPII